MKSYWKLVLVIATIILSVAALVIVSNYLRRPSGAVLLSKDCDDLSVPQWSEDGQWLYYFSGGVLLRYNTKTKDSDYITTVEHQDMLHVSPDGKSAIRVGSGGLLVMDLSSKNSRTIFSSHSISNPRWLPDGRILFELHSDPNGTSHHTTHSGIEVPGDGLVVIRSNGSGLRILVRKKAWVDVCASDGSGFIYSVQSDEDAPDSHDHYYNLVTERDSKLPVDELEKSQGRYLNEVLYLNEHVMIYRSNTNAPNHYGNGVYVRNLKTMECAAIDTPGHPRFIGKGADIYFAPDLTNYCLVRVMDMGGVWPPPQLWVVPMPAETLKKLKEVGAVK